MGYLNDDHPENVTGNRLQNLRTSLFATVESRMNSECNVISQINISEIKYIFQNSFGLKLNRARLERCVLKRSITSIIYKYLALVKTE